MNIGWLPHLSLLTVVHFKLSVLTITTQTGVGLKNAFVGTASSIRIKSDTHYNQLGYDDNTITGVTVASKNLVHTQTD